MMLTMMLTFSFASTLDRMRLAREEDDMTAVPELVPRGVEVAGPALSGPPFLLPPSLPVGPEVVPAVPAFGHGHRLPDPPCFANK